MLNRHERRQLREIEHWFESDDPALVEYVRTAPVKAPVDWRVRWGTRAAIAGAVALFLGIVLAVHVLTFLGVCLGVGGLSLRYWQQETLPDSDPGNEW